MTDAALYCLDAQEKLLDVKWPPEIHALPEAAGMAPMVDGDFVVLFKGLRVRMGIHCTSEAVEMIREHADSDFKVEYP